MGMRVEVLLFGPAASAVGRDRVEVSASEGATAGDVLGALGAQFPSLKGMMPGARLAVNQSFVGSEAPVCAGDEVALIALVGGG